MSDPVPSPATGARTRPTAVIDIDGVVADVRHRLHHLERRPADWGSFFAAVAGDPVLTEGADRVRELARDHDIVWLTGRPEALRRGTARWLADAGLPAGRLLMRPDGDRRPARVLKSAVLRRLVAAEPDVRIAVVLDDDRAVLERLRADGWPVQEADWVRRTERLARAQDTEGRT